MEQIRGLLGVAIILATALALSPARRRINLRVVVGGIVLQFLLAFLLLTFPPVVDAFDIVAGGVTKIISFADRGSEFLFGPKLIDPAGPWGFVFAFRVLPVIVFFASLMAILYHVGVMQRVVAGVAWVMRRTMGVTGAEALSAAANIFVGQTEAPLCVKPYIPTMTRSQIMAVMTGGFATIAGSVMAGYIMLLGGNDRAAQVEFAKHLIAASLMSAPAGFVMAKIMMPETESPREEHLKDLVASEKTTRNVLDAAASGATDGLRLAANVGAMLVAFVALLALLNWPLEAIGNLPSVARWREANHIAPLSLQNLAGGLFKPLAWTLGISWKDSGFFGSLLGTQLIATEFVAYLKLGAALHPDPDAMGAVLSAPSPRTAKIATYALCGFANFPSIAIQIGGLSAIAPNRRSDFATLGLRAMTAGALACWMTGAIAGVFISP